MSENGFSESQKQYIAGLTLGVDVARTIRSLPVLAGSAAANSPLVGTTVRVGDRATPSLPERIAYDAQDGSVAAGKTL